MQNRFRSYALALFTCKRHDQKVQEKIIENIKLIDNVCSLPFFLSFFYHCNNKQIKKLFLQDLCQALKIDDYVIYWLWTIIDNNDFVHFLKISKECIKVFNSFNNLIEVNVSSAFSLSYLQKKQLICFFTKKLKKKIELICHLDKNLICGFKINFANRIYDNSIKFQLNNLKNTFLNNYYDEN